MKMTSDVQTSFQTLGRVFTRMCEEVHDVAGRTTTSERRLEKVEARLERVEGKLEKVEHRLGQVETGLENQTRRISDLDRTMHNGFTELKDQIGRMDQRLAAFIEAQARMAKQGVRAVRRAGSNRPRRRRS
jgi:septal ring factor EnvC (AmiA/AmiB activator)